MTMAPCLATALTQELGVFKRFNQCVIETDRFAGCCCPVPEIHDPHWNGVYLKSSDEILRPDEEQAIRCAYHSYGAQPHVLTPAKRFAPVSVEVHTYLALTGPASRTTAVVAQPLPMIGTFCQFDKEVLPAFDLLMRTVFGISGNIMEYFQSRVLALSETNAPVIVVADEDGGPVGFVNSFRTDDGSDFVFNYAVSKDLQGRGIGTAMMRELMKKTNRPLYVYTDNDVVSQIIMPKLGFSLLGAIYVVPLDAYINQQE